MTASPGRLAADRHQRGVREHRASRLNLITDRTATRHDHGECGGWCAMSTGSNRARLRAQGGFPQRLPGNAGKVLRPPPGTWAQFWSHRLPFTAVHGRPRPPARAGHGRWRTVVNASAQYSKACEGATPPWVQIPPPPPLTCDDATPGGMLNRGGHRGGLIFGPQLVSVKRAEIPAAGWIGPELRPCTAADMIWEETRQVPVGAGRSTRLGRRARQVGCRFPCLRPGRGAHAHAAEACALPFTAGRDRPRPAGYLPT